MSTNIFRMFSPGKSREDRVEKRKAQLRRAQLTYRERKERYTKALEGHVAEARANEADLCREIQDLRSTVRALAAFIRDHGLQIPNEIRLEVESSQPLGDATTVGGWTTQQDQHYFVPHTDVTVPVPNRPHPIPQAEPMKTGVSSNLNNDPLRLGDLDPVATGMEFVLTLERPCINHLYPDEDKAHEPNGHALTASGQLAPAYPKSVLQSHAAHETFRREVPERSLHSLLALSSELCSGPEITPVQAWNYIRCQPLFGGVEVRDLWNLAERLRDAATCHGFGAVIEQDFFQKAIYETLLVGRAF